MKTLDKKIVDSCMRSAMNSTTDEEANALKMSYVELVEMRYRAGMFCEEKEQSIIQYRLRGVCKR